MTTKKVLQVLGVLLSFFFILVGIAAMSTTLQVMSHPDPDSTLPFKYYSIQFHTDNSLNNFMKASAMISAGLTYLWFQRGK
jgi:hypothetical protein